MRKIWNIKVKFDKIVKSASLYWMKKSRIIFFARTIKIFVTGAVIETRRVLVRDEMISENVYKEKGSKLKSIKASNIWVGGFLEQQGMMSVPRCLETESAFSFQIENEMIVENVLRHSEWRSYCLKYNGFITESLYTVHDWN